MKEFKDLTFNNERSLFEEKDARIEDCIFEAGESPLKECSALDIYCTHFKWKYPLWYCKDVKLDECTLFEGARAGIWYTHGIDIKNTFIQASKTFRRSSGISLENVAISRADETLWSCRGIKMKNVSAKGDYFAMNSSDIEVDGLILDGNYSFDGVENALIRNSKLLTKDAFWNSKNITVYDSLISGEYLGWNSENLTLINCTVASLQGMCYIDNLKMVGCKLIDTSLAFEYSKVDADITSSVGSVFNPTSGTIRAKSIGKLIVEKDRVDPELTKIVCDDIKEEYDVIDWENML